MKKNKSIVFVMTTLRTGGIAISLINLLNELANRTNYSLSLILFDKKSIEGINLNKSINVIAAGKLPMVIPLSQKEIKNKSIFLTLNRLVAGAMAKYISQRIAYKFLFRNIKIEKSWDIAISCTQSAPKHHLYGGCNEFVLSKIKASKKLTFIHCDYIAYGLVSKYSRYIYNRFDAIAAVSNCVRERFLEAEPIFRDKTYTVYNCHDAKKIRKLANENPLEYCKDDINIVTVARLGEEKGHFRVLKVLKRLNSEGLHFKWHVVGGGDPQIMICMKDYISKNNLGENVVFYGNQKNPYRFMKNAQALLVPSFHEAAPMVYGEAELLGLPIITTNTISAIELVQNKKIGVVCENSDQGLYSTLRNIVIQPNVITQYAARNLKYNSNEEAVKQFLYFLEGRNGTSI